MKIKFYTSWVGGWVPYRTKKEAMDNTLFPNIIQTFIFDGGKRQFYNFINGWYRSGFYNKKTYNPKLIHKDTVDNALRSTKLVIEHLKFE